MTIFGLNARLALLQWFLAAPHPPHSRAHLAMSGDIFIVTTEERKLLAPRGWRLGMQLNILQCTE